MKLSPGMVRGIGCVLVTLLVAYGLAIFFQGEVGSRGGMEGADLQAPLNVETDVQGAFPEGTKSLPAELSVDDGEHRAEAVPAGRPHSTRGRVRSDSGEWLDSVQVSWTAWDSRFMEFVSCEAPISIEEIESRSITVETDEAGWFEFERGPPLIDGEPSFLWMTHPSHLAQSVELQPGVNQLEEGATWILVRAKPMVARVRHGALPVVGSVVYQQVDFPRDSTASLDNGVHAPKALLVFLRSTETGADGAGPLVPAKHTHRIVATYGDLRSVPWTGVSAQVIQLELEPTCTLTGFVGIPPGRDADMGMPQVRVYRHHGPFTEELAAVEVRGDGTVGPAPLPVLSADSYSFQLAGGAFTPSERRIAPPVVGQHVHLEFEGVFGSSLWFQGFDLADEVLMNTVVHLTWESDGLTGEKTVQARDDGLVFVRGIPAGTARCFMTAPGYGRTDAGLIAVPERIPAIHEVVLGRGYRVAGRCLRGIFPVNDFEVRYWPINNHALRSSVRVTASEDGKFVLEDLSSPRIALQAISEDYGRSAVLTLELSDGAAEEVILGIVSAQTLSGSVVNSSTGEPVVGARVEVHNSHVHYELDAVGPPILTASDGGFSLDRLGPGTNVVSVSASGYSSRELEVVAGARAIDLGEISLRRRQRLTARLVLAEGKDPSGYALATSGIGAIPATGFDSSGELEVESASEGTYLFRVTDNSGLGEVLATKRVTLRVGEDWDLDFHLISGDRTLLVTTTGVDPSSDPTSFVVGATYHDLDGNEDFQAVRLDRHGEARVRGKIGAGPVSLRVSGGKSPQGGGATRMISPDERGEIPIHVELTSKAVQVRVVDGAGVPMSGVEVLPRSDEAAGMVLGWQFTDAAGEARFRALAPATNEMTLSSISGGVVDHVPFEFPRDGETVELRFHMNSSIDVFLHDGGASIITADCRLSSGEFGYTLTPGHAPDDTGHVVFSGLGAGEYVLQASAPARWTIFQPVVASPARTEIAIELRRVGSLVVDVVGLDGGLRAGLPVTLVYVPLAESVNRWVMDGRLFGQAAPLATDAQGRIRLEGIPQGSYQWQCGGATGSIELHAGSVLETVIEVP